MAPQPLIVSLALATVLLAACGSTVPIPQGGDIAAANEGLVAGTAIDPGTGLGQPGTGLGQPDGMDGVTGTTGTPVAGASGGRGPGAGGEAAAGPSAAGQGLSAPQAAATTRRGVTDTEIAIGIYTSDDASQVGSSIGLNVSFGDLRAQTRALADDINRRGGVLGRELVLRYHDVSSASMASNPNSTIQAACTAFTEDQEVVAVMSTNAGLNTDQYFKCMADGGVSVYYAYLGVLSQDLSARYAPFHYGFGVAQMERSMAARLDSARDVGYFTPWDTRLGQEAAAGEVRIGTIYIGRPEGRRFLQLLKKGLKARGLELHSEFEMSPDADEALSQVPAAMLRLRSDDVTHVLPESGMVLLAAAAENQGYRPRWGFTSTDAPALMQDSVPEEQLHGSVGIGWVQASDVDAARDPGDNASQKRCRKLMEGAGQDTSNRLALTVMFAWCDEFWTFADGFNAAGSFDPAAVAAGTESLGERAGNFTFGQRFAASKNRWLGPVLVRDMAYDDECSCMTYHTGTHGI